MLSNLVLFLLLSAARAQEVEMSAPAPIAAVNAVLNQCELAISETVTEPAGVLNTGVLVLDSKGKKHLLTGPYLFQSHHDLLDRMVIALKLRDVQIAKVLLMGEFRIEHRAGQPVIDAVNETSGYYFEELVPKGFFVFGKSVPVENDSRALPKSWLAPGCIPEHFNPEKTHLAPELNVDAKNLRHDLINSLTVLHSLFVNFTLKKAEDPGFLKKRIDQFPGAGSLVFVLDFAEKKKLIKPEQIHLIKLAVAAVSRAQPDIKELRSINEKDLHDQIHALTENSYHFYSFEGSLP